MFSITFLLAFGAPQKSGWEKGEREPWAVIPGRCECHFPPLPLSSAWTLLAVSQNKIAEVVAVVPIFCVVWCIFEISPDSWPISTQCSNIKGHLVTDSSIPPLRTPSNSGESHLTRAFVTSVSVSARSIEICGHFWQVKVQACKWDVFWANWVLGFGEDLSLGMFSWVFIAPQDITPKWTISFWKYTNTVVKPLNLYSWPFSK